MKIRQVMGMMYDVYSAIVLRERMALSAVDEPMLMSDRRTMTTLTNAILRIGTLYVASTCLKYPENGSPSSRANAHVRRLTLASVPNMAAMVMVRMSE